ncbi:MAG TPA: hypothetical protein VGE04_15175 [Chloroflexia bacterium]
MSKRIHRRVAIFTLLGLLWQLIPAGTQAEVGATLPSLQTCRDAPETPYFGSAGFENLWRRTDQLVACGQVSRSWYWGPKQASGPIYEQYNQGPGGTRLVQYYDKSRMEINNPEKHTDEVTNGLLTVELVSGKMQVGNAAYEDHTAAGVPLTPANIPLASDNDDTNAPTYASFVQLANTTLGDHPAQDLTGQTVNQRVNKSGAVSRDTTLDSKGVKYGFYNAETKHNIAGQIWDFLNTSGPVRNPNGGQANAKLSDPWFYTSGYAISEPYWANVKIDGKQTDVLIQLFQRRVVTYQPNGAPGFQVQMGNIGRHYIDWRYQGGLPGQMEVYETGGSGGRICRGPESALCVIAKANDPSFGVAYVGHMLQAHSTGTLSARVTSTKTKYKLLENSALQLKASSGLSLHETILLMLGSALFDHPNAQGEFVVEAGGVRTQPIPNNPNDPKLLRLAGQLQPLNTIFSVEIQQDGSVKIVVVQGPRGVLVTTPDGQTHQVNARDQLVVPASNTITSTPTRPRGITPTFTPTVVPPSSTITSTSTMTPGITPTPTPTAIIVVPPEQGGGGGGGGGGPYYRVRTNRFAPLRQ